MLTGKCQANTLIINAIYCQLHFPTATPLPWPNVCWTPKAGKLTATPRLWPKATPPGWALALDKAPALVWPFGPMDPVPTPPAVPPPVPTSFLKIKHIVVKLHCLCQNDMECTFFGSAHHQLFYKIQLKRTMDLFLKTNNFWTLNYLFYITHPISP